ncbi:MAG: hypothetical protein ABJA67_06655 [Chthonomonadales bacterium]
MYIFGRLRSTAGIVLTLFALSGCGGSLTGNAPSNGGGGPGGGGGPADSRSALFNAIDALVATFNHKDRDAENDRLLAFLKTKSDFVDSGIDETGVVWAHFADNTTISLCNNLEVTDPGFATRSRRARVTRSAGIPVSTRAFIGVTVGPIYDLYTTGVRTMLDKQHYSETPADTVERLKGLNKASVLYIFGHGGVMSSPHGAGKTYGVYTSTKRTAALDAQYAADIQDGSLLWMWGGVFPGTEENPGDEKFELHYAITAKFVQKYWTGKFDPNSVVFINACNSASDDAFPFRTACLTAGASVYLGWDHRMILQDALGTGAYLFDRLTGTNLDVSIPTDVVGGIQDIPKESPPQKAFDIHDVLAEMGTRVRPGRRYAFDQTYDLPHKGSPNLIPTKLLWLSLNDNFGQLAPSIRDFMVDEQRDEIQINGTFGEKPGKVLLGTAVLTVKDWTPEQIMCALPRNGTGDVQIVLTGGQKSNKVQLTGWRGPITLTNTFAGSLQMVIRLETRFRADVVSTRIEPHGQEFEADGVFLHSLDSTGTYEFSGKFVSPGDASGHWEETWSGTGVVTPAITIPVDPSPPPVSSFYFQGGFQPNRHWRLEMNVSIVKGKHVKLTHFDKNGVINDVQTRDDNALWVSSSNPNGGAYLQVLGAGYSIAPGSWTYSNGPNDVRTMEWGQIPTTDPPDPKAARSARVKTTR